MLPKDQRLKKRGDFERVFKKGKSYSSFLFTVRNAPNGLPYSRFGFVVSNKISKKATVRNLIKRRLRDSVRRAPMTLSGDVVVIVKPAVVPATFQDMQRDLYAIFEKISKTTPRSPDPRVSKDRIARP